MRRQPASREVPGDGHKCLESQERCFIDAGAGIQLSKARGIEVWAVSA